MAIADDTVSDQQNPYAVGMVICEPESTSFPQRFAAVAIGVFSGILAAGIGFVFTWVAVGVIMTVAAPQVRVTESFTAFVVLPSIMAVLFGITTGLRVGWKLNAVMGRVQQVKQKRVDLAASASQLTEELKNARLQKAIQDAHPK